MIDLHTHSTASDGTFTPKELAQEAIKIGLSAIALTDHDVVNGVSEFTKELKNSNVIAIAGAELGAFYPNVEVEVLAINIKDLNPYFEREQVLLQQREEVNHKRIELLQKAGMNITWDEVAFDENGKARDMVSKPHICEAILKKGYETDKEIVYKKILGKGGVAYVEKLDPPLKETIEFIVETGAVPILAHPVLTGLAGDELFEFIKMAQSFGLLGMEVFHSKQPRELQKSYLELAEELNLIVSGGSDFHGAAHPDIHLGKGALNKDGTYNVNIPDIVLAPILEANLPSKTFYQELQKYI